MEQNLLILKNLILKMLLLRKNLLLTLKKNKKAKLFQNNQVIREIKGFKADFKE